MASDGTRGELVGARAMLDAWREAGADRVAPVRFQFMDALERRAAAHGGEARRLLDGKLAALIQAYESELDSARDPDSTPNRPAAATPEPGPLAALTAYMADPGADARGTTNLRASYPELESLEYFRSVWSRVSADRQVRQSQEQVHKNAGPLNSNQLVHRALSLMREVSPGYLQQFLSYTDALMWLEQVHAALAPPPREAAPRAGAKKTARGKGR
ncbi:Protein of uncharacterised function (DUF2894) [Achromobacter insolitus]|uniref:DUF2894 domain-containing protein n=1 Tax=Achromobacter insolitus TaxID=217204 RepID=UPI0009728C3F|nr:DUF2894 domain-containing protein [Achromobacter insolitus]APX74812.1 hypothetical protein BUW96_07965 [Achromobacter insolitus]OWT55416.1 hypothetical protein CEY08_24620 [Achromobacter insolitus]CAB3731290.1 hypothetical protein LMG6003_04796 [Achromobacter insolitus]VEG68051.1 Protein of uncharacterised function (DUF2894) [Achromobacter insolitus]